MTESPMSLARRIYRMEAAIKRLEAGQGTPQLASSSIEDGSVDEHDADGRLVSRIGKQVDGSHGSRVVESPDQPTPDAPDLSVGKTGVIAVRWGGGADAPVPLVHGHIEVQAMGPSDADWQVVGTIRDRDGGATTFAADESGTTQVRLVLVGQDRVTRSAPSTASGIHVELPASTSEVQAAQESADGKNIVFYDPDPPSTDGEGVGDIFFQIDDVTGVVQKAWRWDGSAWVEQSFGDAVLDSISAGKITAGTIEAAVGIGSSGYIRSTDGAGRMSEMVGAGFRTEAADGTIIFDSRGGTGDDSTAFGRGASSSGTASTALGRNATAARAFATALGEAALADAEGTVALGQSSEATAYGSMALGTEASAAGSSAAAVGTEASAGGGYATAVGRRSSASAVSSTAVGYEATASGGIASAFGREASAGGSYSTALGASASAAADYATAVGRNATADVTEATALGYAAIASGSASTALGFRAVAQGSDSTALGWEADSFGQNSLALGKEASATNVGSTALGHQSEALHNYATALGYQATASGDVSTALGPGSSASGYASVAVGRGAEATEDNVGVLGGAGSTRTNHWIVPGDFDVQGTAGGDGLIREISSPVIDSYGNNVADVSAFLIMGRLAVVNLYLSSVDIPQTGGQDTPIVRLHSDLGSASNREQWSAWVGGGIGMATGLVRSDGDVSIRWARGSDSSTLLVTTLTYIVA